MLDHGHNHYLVVASFAVALMSGFTGLSLTRGASSMPQARRKLMVAMSAIALGGGIWSMHFVAMLGLRLPFEFYYDGLTTLISALVAILITGIALLMVHFGTRTPLKITLAGACVGIGIPVMHYLGMSGMQIAQPIYAPVGIAEALIASLVLCIGSFWISYGNRRALNILLGTAGFGISVFAVHFVAMAGTTFVEADGADTGQILRLSNDALAIGVTLSAFAISGAFLLVGVTFNEITADTAPPEPGPEPAPVVPESVGRLPYEQEGRINFVPEAEVAVVRAEGHYTLLYHASGRLFCPWSISEVQRRVNDAMFLRAHRSYLINATHVQGFERKKDNGVCYFGPDSSIEKAPVSRSYLKDVRDRLGL